MLNIYELEKKWLKYKVKSFLPAISIFIILLISIIAIYLFVDLKKLNILDTSILNTLTKSQEQNISKKVQEPFEKEISVAQSNNTQQKIKTVEKIQNTKPLPSQKVTPVHEKNILEPSLGFMSKMQHEPTSSSEQKPVKQVTETKKSIPKSTIQVPKEQTVTKVIEKPKTEVIHETNTITIKKQNTYEDIDYVIKRFKKNNNPALSLFVAKKYYELGEYKQAYNYALITNEINNNIEASWIVFSKSLVKLNQKAKAIQTLKQYINYSNSNQARLLLEEIVSGKFK